MMTNKMFQEALENFDKPSLIIKESTKGYIAYFRDSPSSVGIGKTESEALSNLQDILKKVSEELNAKVERDTAELKRRHRKLWNY